MRPWSSPFPPTSKTPGEDRSRHRAARGERREGLYRRIVQSYAANILAEYARELSTELRPSISNARQELRASPSAEMGRIEPRLRSWYNQSLNYQHYMVPDLGLWSR